MLAPPGEQAMNDQIPNSPWKLVAQSQIEFHLSLLLCPECRPRFCFYCGQKASIEGQEKSDAAHEAIGFSFTVLPTIDACKRILPIRQAYFFKSFIFAPEVAISCNAM
jgi:hypothetical protein